MIFAVSYLYLKNCIIIKVVVLVLIMYLEDADVYLAIQSFYFGTWIALSHRVQSRTPGNGNICD